MADLVTCKYCGVVERGHRCEHRPKRKNIKNRESDRFRSSAVWKKKAEECKQRDRYLCRVCVAGLYNTLNQINYKNLEAHHIIPIAEDYNKRLDNDNIITLCQMHHKMAERGQIPREVLFEILASPPPSTLNKIKKAKIHPTYPLHSHRLTFYIGFLENTLQRDIRGTPKRVIVSCFIRA